MMNTTPCCYRNHVQNYLSVVEVAKVISDSEPSG